MGKILVIALTMWSMNLFADAQPQGCNRPVCSDELPQEPAFEELLAPNVIGNCYIVQNCFGNILAYNVTTDFCEGAGGHSILSNGFCYSF